MVWFSSGNVVWWLSVMAKKCGVVVDFNGEVVWCGGS